MTKKFIIISQVPLSNKIYIDWFIKDLRAIYNKKLEYWFISGTLKKNNDPFKLKTNFTKEIKNFEQFDKQIDKLKSFKVIFLSLFPLTKFNERYIKKIKKKNFYLIHILWGFIPYDFPDIYERIKNKIKLYLKKKPLFYKFTFRYYKIFDLVFYAGDILKKKADYLSDKSVKINLIDFDRYKKNKNNKTQNIAVFLDQALTCHSDDQSNKKKNHLKYYQSLENFFKRIEIEFNLKVIIALHPKNWLPNKIFFKRKVCRNKTAELVSKSDLVLCHTSISISYAILNYKPIVFLHSKLINKYSDFGEDALIMDSLKRYLNANKIHIDKNICNLRLNFQPNIKLYTKYINNFIASRDTLNKSSANIFLNEILKIK